MPAIRRAVKNGAPVVIVLGADAAGPCMRGLDVAEAASRPARSPRSLIPITRRTLPNGASSFNIPLDLRTPSYSGLLRRGAG